MWTMRHLRMSYFLLWCCVGLVICPHVKDWINLSNNYNVDRSKSIYHPKNKDPGCLDRKIINRRHHDMDIMRSIGIFFNISDNDAHDNSFINNTGWIEAKDDEKPIMDALPLEGNSFCISGRHYRNSPELLNHINMIHMKGLAEHEFDIGSHVYPKDYSQMNYFLPDITNIGLREKVVITGTVYVEDPDQPKAPPVNPLFTKLPLTADPTKGDPDEALFFLKWKRATDNFFHIRRTRLIYTNKDDGPRRRSLKDPKYLGSTFRKGDAYLGHYYRPAIPENQPDPKCRNPYFIDVTQIEVNGVALHNWLHITLYVRKENIVRSAKNCATGRMRWVMLEVRDSLGLPIGDFNSDFPCGASCTCKSSNCDLVNGVKENAMPCMFTPMRSVTQPGLFMYGVPEGESFSEVHATWHFAQHSSYFATELHFAALVVEKGTGTKYYNGRRTRYRNPRYCMLINTPFIFAKTWEEHQGLHAGVHNFGTYPQGQLLKHGLGPGLAMYYHNQYDTKYRAEPYYCYRYCAYRAVTSVECRRYYLDSSSTPAQPPPAGYPYIHGPSAEYQSNHTASVWAWDEAAFGARYFRDFRTGYDLDKLQSSYLSHCMAKMETGENPESWDMTYHYRFFRHRPEEFYEWSLQHTSKKERPYGWTAQYSMLKPTLETLGGWDYFKVNPLIDPARINCHKKINQDAYEENKQIRKLKSRLPLRRNYYSFRYDYTLGDVVEKNISYDKVVKVSEIYDPRSAETMASNDSSDFETKCMQIPLVINVTNPAKTDPLKAPTVISMNRVYFGTLRTKLAYEDELNKDAPDQKGYDDEFQNSEIGKFFANQPTMLEIAIEERCACPKFGSTEDPERATLDIRVLQARNAHAIQMLLAWVVMIPVGMFVIRYYKETFNRVFILEEYWWYTAHVMCMGTAFIFMIGGIYSIEVKRIEPANFWALSDESKAHIILGSLAMLLFGLQLFLSPFRMWIVTYRLINIVFHFLIGTTNYLLGVTAVLISTAIPQSRMSCSAFYIYSGYLVFQGALYVFMELHMRYVDRILMLYPPRSYLPPPIVRVFHTNAPMAKFRLYILAFYLIVCWMMFFVLRYGAIELDVASCFKNLGNDYEDDA